MDLNREVQRLENSELAPLKLPSSVISEPAFLEAIRDKTIALDSMKNILDTLLGVIHKVGLRAANVPDKNAMGVLINHVVRNYGGHSCKEVTLAFDMAMTGKLAVDPNCYENFSCLYFSNILNAYRKWAAEEYKQIKHEDPEQPVEDNTSDESIRTWLADLKAKAADAKVEFMPPMVFEWLLEKGQISYDQKECEEYLIKAVEFMEMQLRTKGTVLDSETSDRKEYTRFRAMITAGEFTGEYATKLPILARKLRLYDFIKQP